MAVTRAALAIAQLRNLNPYPTQTCPSPSKAPTSQPTMMVHAFLTRAHAAQATPAPTPAPTLAPTAPSTHPSAYTTTSSSQHIQPPEHVQPQRKDIQPPQQQLRRALSPHGVPLKRARQTSPCPVQDSNVQDSNVQGSNACVDLCEPTHDADVFTHKAQHPHDNTTHHQTCGVEEDQNKICADNNANTNDKNTNGDESLVEDAARLLLPFVRRAAVLLALIHNTQPPKQPPTSAGQEQSPRKTAAGPSGGGGQSTLVSGAALPEVGAAALGAALPELEYWTEVLQLPGVLDTLMDVLQQQGGLHEGGLLTNTPPTHTPSTNTPPTNTTTNTWCHVLVQRWTRDYMLTSDRLLSIIHVSSNTSTTKSLCIRHAAGLADTNSPAYTAMLLQRTTPHTNTLPPIAAVPLPPCMKLIPLPHVGQDVYLHISKAPCVRCGLVPKQPALCMLCGQLLCCEGKVCMMEETDMPLRDCCSDHAAMCGAGAGVFFMPMLTFVLCVRNDRLSMVAALYVDRHGEEDPGMRRGRYGCV